MISIKLPHQQRRVKSLLFGGITSDGNRPYKDLTLNGRPHNNDVKRPVDRLTVKLSGRPAV